MPTVSNASPLIALSAIGRLELLPALFGSVEIPSAVAAEIAPSVVVLPEWLHVRLLALTQPALVESSGLGDGEREALALSLELHAERVILDDLPARRLAQALGLRVVGTLGVLLAAKRLGLLERIQPCLHALRDRRFFMGQRLYAEILRLADEADD